VEALYENGLLRPTRPLKLRQGEKVGLIVLRHPDPARWDLRRLAQGAPEDETLAESGLDAWADALEAEDSR
jgi:predicted DNA-binding antitoxin AbrB/MazE fold protein